MGWATVKGRSEETVPFAWVRKLSPKIPRKGSKTLGDILAIFTDQNNGDLQMILDSLLAQHEWHVAWEQNQHKFSTKREIRLEEKERQSSSRSCQKNKLEKKVNSARGEASIYSCWKSPFFKKP
ncbi:unnamed protein product [Prunus armeniaca]